VKTLTSWFVVASFAGYFGALTVATLASATFIAGEFVGAGTDQIFTGMYVRYSPVGSIAVLRS